MYLGLKFAEKEMPANGSFDNIHYETNGTDPTCRTNQHTYKESIAFAKAKGGRLCTPEELQSLLAEKNYLTRETSYVATMEKVTKRGKWVSVS